MTNSLRYYLNPTFAIVFAVGVDRLFKLLDPLIIPGPQKISLLTPNVYVPITLIVFTLIAGTLSAASNDMWLEQCQNVSPASSPARLTYASILCIAFMFYLSLDFNLVPWWILTYASLCLVNALWNSLTLKGVQKKPHVAINVVLGASLLVAFLLNLYIPFLLHSNRFWPPVWLYVVLAVVAGLKGYQRRHPRSYM
jgi:hypothetical protein